MATKRIRFPNPAGLLLDARLDLPLGAPRAHAIFAHCFTCTMNLQAVGAICDALTGAGVAVLRFDFTGLGESEGDFADTNFSTQVADLVAAAGFLTRQHQAPALLVGHSLGGAAVLQAAAAIDSVQAVTTIGAPSEPAHVTCLLGESRREIEARGEATVHLAGRPFRIKRQFLDDLEIHNMATAIGQLGRALLILHAPQDDIVGIDNATAIYTTARHPKSFISLDGADHLLSNLEDARYAGRVIATWATRYIDGLQPAVTTPRDDDWLVAEIGASGYTTGLRVGSHALVADEPAGAGGHDQGPSPYDFVNAALGSCTAMTLRMYADRKNWPLDSVTVRLRHTKIHARDCADCETATGRIDQIERILELRGDLSAPQRQRLLEIADRCPVHRTLHGDVRVVTTLARD